MLRAHGVEQVRAAEERMAAGLPDGELMRRAASGLARALDDIAPGEVVLMLIGPGNNGGDALFAAVHLLSRGVRVDLCLLDEAKAHADGLAAALAAGASVVPAPSGFRVVVDALFGIGSRQGLEGLAADWARWARQHAQRVIAVDVPSGIGVDTATLPEAHVRADRTVTFGTYKPALLVDPAASASDSGGARVADLVDIGLAPHLDSPLVEALEVTDAAQLFRAVRVDGPVHKYTRGVVGVAAGSIAYAGAAHLCVAGAQAGLAGMVRFVGPTDLAARVVDAAPEVVAGRGRVQAWVVGPGGGDDTADHLTMALGDGVPVVVDAEALRHLPPSFDTPALLTPHAGELATLLGVERDAVEAAPLAHATAAAERWNATVLLKGARTLVAQVGAPTRVNLTGSPWLATAGSGDVLAGLAGSLLAAGLSPREAGSWAAFLHGAASVRANPGGPVRARDVARALPGTIAALRSGSLAEADVRDWSVS